MKKKLLSLALSLALCAMSLPTSNIFAIETLENETSIASTDRVTHTENAKKTRYIVMFKDKPVSATTKKYTKKSEKLEKKAFKTQNNSIKKIEKIAKTKVKSKNTFLVNACSIDATYEDAIKIKKLDSVADCYEAFAYNPCQTPNIGLSNITTKEYDNSISLFDDEIKLPYDKNTESLDGEGTIISIIDTGVDYTHLDLLLDSSEKTKYTYEETMSKIKGLGYGSYINSKVPFAYNYAERCSFNPHNIHFHGSHVAGIASANPAESNATKGIAPNSQILSMQVYPGSGEAAYTDDIVQAIEDSVKLGADVINLSLGTAYGSSEYDTLELKAVNSAYNSGCIISASAGNNGNSVSNSTIGYNNPYNLCDTGTVSNPSTFQNALSVASCDTSKENIKMAYDSSWGPTPELKIKPEITAPGVNIRSLNTNNGYKIASGTSMATPYISGVSALIKQSIKAKELNLSGSSLSTFIKNSIMNTATPLMDFTYANGAVPYSVRQQGSGLVNIQNAIDNNVIATYNGDAKIELGNIEEGKTSIPIEIKLTNYGKTDESYIIEYNPLYTETTNTLTGANGVCLKELEYSSIAFPNPNITVKAGETVTVQGRVVISPDTINQYIEGFIKINNIKDDISLSLPVLGFYGNWDMLPIFDEPSGSKNCVMDKYGYDLSTYIADKDFNTLGLCGDKFDLNRSAISLNPDSSNNIAIPYLTQLRNAYNVNVSVVDSNNQLVQDLGSYDYLRKTAKTTEQLLKASAISNNKTSYAYWDGTKYDEQTAETIPVKDGQYYFWIKAKHTKNAPYQNYKIPIQVDSIAPEADIKYERDNLKDKIYFDVLEKENCENLTNITFNVYYSEDSKDSVTYNYNKDGKLLDNGYRRFTMNDIQMFPVYINAKIMDYAKNKNRIDLYKTNYFDENEVDLEQEETTNNNDSNVNHEQDKSDNKGPVVDIIPNNNLTNTCYKSIFKYSNEYTAKIKNSNENVELTFNISDQSNISTKNPPSFIIKTQKIASNTLITKDIELKLNQINSSKYKIILSPDDLKNTWEIKDTHQIVFNAQFYIYDVLNNQTIISFTLYFPEDNMACYDSSSTKIKAEIPHDCTINKDDLNPDNTYTVNLDVIGTDFEVATINGIVAEKTYAEDYEYTNIPSRTIHLKANIPIEIGKNYYTVCLYKTNEISSRNLIYEKSYGTILYNGDNISFTENSKSPVSENIYMCNSDTFNFNLNVNSKINALIVKINNSVVYSYNEIQINYNENNIVSLPLSYKLKGKDVNTLKISVIDLCGNKTEKIIKAKNVYTQPNNKLAPKISYTDINDLSIKLASQYTYTGKKIKPAISIKDGNYKLVKNTDYKVSYTNNKKIGKAKVKITGINKYKGIVNKTFKIVPKKSSIIKVSNNNHGKTTIKVKKVKGNVKYEIFYSTKKNGKYKKLSTSNKPVLITNKLKRNKNYFIKVRTYKIVKKKKLKCKFSKAKKIKL